MKKLIIFVFVLSLFSSSSVFAQLPNSINIMILDYESCNCDINVCLDVCWSETDNCNDDESIICNTDCWSIPDNTNHLLSVNTGGHTVCESKLVIYTSACQHTFPLPLVFPPSGILTSDCNCQGCPPWRIKESPSVPGQMVIYQ